MRLIGHLPSETNAATFSGYLLAHDISNEVEAGKEGWAVWIHSEDEWRRAREMLETFVGNPTDPRYQAKAAAVAARGRFQPVAAAPEERGLDRDTLLTATIPYGVGAVTLVLIGVSLALALLSWIGFEDRISRELLITNVPLEPNAAPRPRGLSEIAQGEFWRLLTPTLVNLDVLPLLFNTLLLLHLGSMIEGRLSAGRLGLLFIVLGVLSNLAQYYVNGPQFCGAAGVLFGLLGYIWMRGRLDPATGLFLRPQTVALMLIFYVIGLVGAYGSFFKLSLGTTAQMVGLAMGLAWGFLSSLPALRQRT
jgi:GlpG protein